MLNSLSRICLLALFTGAAQAGTLALAPEEFAASRQMACVLAQQSLGQLSEDEYGARTHTVLDGFDEDERSNILAKALGYYDGLMFQIAEDDPAAVDLRLETFVSSGTCDSDFRSVTVSL